MSNNNSHDAAEILALERELLSQRDEARVDALDLGLKFRILVGAYQKHPEIMHPLSVCVFVDNLAARSFNLASSAGNFLARLASTDDGCQTLIDRQIIPQMRKFPTPPHGHSGLAIFSATIHLFADHPEQFRQLCEGYYKKLANPTDPFFAPETIISTLKTMAQYKPHQRIDGFLANGLLEGFIATAENREANIPESRAASIRTMAFEAADVIDRKAPDWLKFTPERPAITPTAAVAAWIARHE